MFARQQDLTTLHSARVGPILLILLLLTIPTVTRAAQPALQQVGNGLIQETNSGLFWQMERSKKLRSPAAVENYLHQLNQGVHHDWRLPTKWELYDFLSKFDLKKNGGISIALEGSYWLKEDKGTVYPGSWDTGDQCGLERTFFSAKSGYVRAIRP
ncbi:MAG: hypothetical protein PHI97_00070 [Desulfobulbus sp.]|nr:hypothetical protein [Desulfobulbus sp.]